MKTSHIALAAALAVLAAPALAEDAAADAASGETNASEFGDQIIVTGEKIDRSLQDTPTSVRVVTSKEIEQENLIDLFDVIQRTANLTSTFGGSGFTIRGISNSNITGVGTGDLATVYVDGSPLPRTALAGPLDLWDLAQVEVLRGPQSTLQGRNALAGAIILKTADPTYDWSGKARVILTDKMDEKRVGIAIGGPIVPDQVAFRIAAEHSRTDGLITNVTRDDDKAGFKNGDMIRGKLLITPTAIPDLRILASWLHDRHSAGETYSFTDPSIEDSWTQRELFGNRPTIDHTKSDIGTFDVSYALGPVFTLSSTTTWSRIRPSTEYDGDNTAADTDYGGFSQDQKTLTEEVKLIFNSDNFTGLIGAYYSDFRNKHDLSNSTFSLSPVDDLGLPPEVAPFYPDQLYVATEQFYPQTIKNKAIFADATWTVAPRFKLHAGFRYDDERQVRANNNIVTLITALPDPADFGPYEDTIAYINSLIDGFVAEANSVTPAFKTKFDAFLPKVGATYEFSDDASLSATVQRGYRSGGSGVNPGLGELYTYNPEYTWNYEVALRSQWLDRTLTLNANAFYIDWTDQQVIYYPPPRQTYNYYTINAGTSRVYGFEVETRYSPSREFSFYASAGYSNTRFTDFVVGEEDFTGNRFPNAPRWTLAGGATWTSAQGWFANVNANWRSAAAQDVAVVQDLELKAHALVNAKVGWQAEHYGVFLTATNIFNQHYFDYQYQNGAHRQALLGEPRVFGVTLEAGF